MALYEELDAKFRISAVSVNVTKESIFETSRQSLTIS